MKYLFCAQHSLGGCLCHPLHISTASNSVSQWLLTSMSTVRESFWCELNEVCKGEVCAQSKVTGRFLWESGLVLVLFSTFINSLEKAGNSEMTKFAAGAEVPEWYKSGSFSAETHHGTVWALH